MFLSQLPYMPLGDLRGAVCYPADEGTYSDDEIRSSSTPCRSGTWPADSTRWPTGRRCSRPASSSGWRSHASCWSKPKVVFLDEATSALDEGQEYALYRALRSQLPDCIVVSVSHRPSLEQHHDRRLELLGDGGWRLAPV